MATKTKKLKDVTRRWANVRPRSDLRKSLGEERSSLEKQIEALGCELETYKDEIREKVPEILQNISDHEANLEDYNRLLGNASTPAKVNQILDDMEREDNARIKNLEALSAEKDKKRARQVEELEKDIGKEMYDAVNRKDWKSARKHALSRLDTKKARYSIQFENDVPNFDRVDAHNREIMIMLKCYWKECGWEGSEEERRMHAAEPFIHHGMTYTKK